MKIPLAGLLIAAALSATPAAAKFMSPQQVPVDRLLKRAQSHLDAHPAEADAHYTLARIHYLAFARGSRKAPAFPSAEDGKPEIPGNWMIGFDLYEARRKQAEELALKDIGERGPRVPQEKASAFDEARGRRARQLEEQNWQPKGDLSAAEMIAHASAAVAGFRAAMKLDPANGLYPLGLASVSENFADWTAGRKLATLPPELRGLTHAAARAWYLEAFRLAIRGDAKLSTLPVSGLASLVSYEAGNGFVRLAERDHATLPAGDKAALATVKSGLAKLKRIPFGAITPIVFSFKKATHLDPLLAPETHVPFDLRGFGPRERWPWVRPTTAFLVWDPARQGAITSGRQLFGSYTFEIFRRTGYDALAALDDDGDGALRGGELRGIRAWFDTNSDGQSEPDEVRDLSDLGIAAIAVHATMHDGPHPANPRGLTLRDGRTLPTWDWIAKPLPR